MVGYDLAEFLILGSSVEVQLVILVVVIFLDFSHLLFYRLLDRSGHPSGGKDFHQTVVYLLVHHSSLPRGSHMSQESFSSNRTRGVRESPLTLLLRTPGL